MTYADLAAKSSHLRTSGPSTWPTRRSWPTGCTEDPSCRTADLTQVRSTPPTCMRTPHHQDGRHGERCDDMVKGATAWNQRPTPTGRPLLHPGFPTPASDLPRRALNRHSSGRAPLCAEVIAKRAA
ncbi:hypothetical protein BHM03_00017460 [Ensete ventricosum]|uniref:Uncharacterized protein n=1 Tax=Ensete ventricosum TaxID=4639 RepID=A0A445MF48_ENSVE|nr:hypothetical protein BHM03_00017460 [Ensete ventricosum]